jgi:acetyl-CoA synthetase
MDSSSIIRKTAADMRLPPNLANYAGERQVFAWDRIRGELDGLPGGGLNIAHEAVERQAWGPLRDKTAFRFLARGVPARDVRFGELSVLTSRFANMLEGLGIGRGERVFVLAGRIP